MELQRTKNSQNSLKENVQIGVFTLPHFKTYYKTTVIKIACYWNKVKHIDQ